VSAPVTNLGPVYNRESRKRLMFAPSAHTTATRFKNADGTWPARTVPVDRVVGLSSRELSERYARTNTPVIVEDFIPQEWQRLADPTVLRRDHGEVELRVMRDIPANFLSEFTADRYQLMSMKAFVDWLESPERKLPCYANQQTIDSFPAIANSVTFEKLAPGLKPAFVWFGSEGSNIGLHFDPSDTLLAQLWGTKAFFLVPFEDSGRVYPFADDVTRSTIDLRSFDLDKFDKLGAVAPYVGEMLPGDLLYIPRYTWHYFWGTSTSVSASVFNAAEINARRIAKLLYMYGGRYALGTIKQMVDHGILDKPYAKRAYGWPPFGLILWKLLTGRFKEFVAQEAEKEQASRRKLGAQPRADPASASAESAS
jgi:hypothetical protein